ncbi:serine/threonine-protein kinase M1 [Xylographa bjoerkii]|nr:serine/threonine-protein kinase M1 [Xylographa bjoerkii]
MAAHRAARYGQPQSEVHGQQANGHPPPSTFAAQIVDNLASARQLSKSTDKQADLRQLLQMILDADHDGDTLSEAIETSIEVNYRLIYTIVRAGLEVLSSHNPFENTRDVHVQALNTLAVVDLTIRRCPEVLFWVPSNNDPTVRPGGPLFLWLVPHLINLLGHRFDKEVSEGAANVLGTMLSAQTRASTSRIRLRPVLKYIQGCIKDLMFFVDAVQDGEIVPDSFQVPTNDTVMELYRQPLEPENQRTMSSIKHDDLSQDLATALLSDSIFVLLQCDPEEMTFDLEIAICWSIYDLLAIGKKFSGILEIYQEHLGSLLNSEDGRRSYVDNLSLDLQRALALASHHSVDGRLRSPIAPSQHQLLDFEDSALKDAFHRILVITDEQERDDETVRPRKRARLSDVATSAISVGTAEAAMEDIYLILQLPLTSDLDQFGQSAASCFPTLSENDQCQLFTAIGETPCKIAQTWTLAQGQCSVCDTEDWRSRLTGSADQRICTTLLSTTTNLLKLLHGQGTPRPRVAAMASFRRLLAHSEDPNYLDLRISPIGQWCLQALRSSLRDLRIAAGRTLTVFLQEGLDDTFLRQNRITALEFLRGLSERSGLALQETCLLAWGQIATVSSEDEMNLVLLRLIEYLGHTNPLICGLAYEELLRICGSTPVTAMRLFEPYWRTIAVVIVKDLQSRPQIVQRVCDLLNMTVSQFLQITQFYTIPYLIATKRKDLLQRIAAACASENSIKSLCMGHAQLAAILSFLLLQPSTDQESMIMSLLKEASPDFQDADIVELMKSEPMLTAFELLKVAGEEEEGRSARVHQAIHMLADYSQRRSGSTKGSSRRSGGVGLFFEQHVIGIMALLSDIIGEREGSQSFSEKRRCIGAIREMIRLAKSHVCNALPQASLYISLPFICACLQSAIEDRELCNEAFGVWIILVSTLGEEDVENLVNPTFAIIAQHWQSFNANIHERTHQMISLLLKTHSGMVREMINTIPSLDSIPLLSKFEAELSKLKAQSDPRHQFQAFSLRCQNENPTVVLRALTELEVYLTEFQSFLHLSAVSEQPDPVITQLVRSLLDTCVRLSGGSSPIALLCAKCLGLIGCLDPTRIEAARENQEILVLSNFGKANETIDFVIFFVQEVLVKAFLSATNTRAQSFLGYVIQELLKFCTFDTSVTFRDGSTQSSDTYRRWVAIPETVRNTLTPFLTSKYVLSSPGVPSCVYPLYKTGITHSQWLRDFVFDLLRKGCGANAAEMFPVFRRAVRGQDISIPSFLLPFVALNIAVGGTEEQRNDIASELLVVLSETVPENNQFLRDNMVSCSEVLDYFSRWVHEKKKELAGMISSAARQGRILSKAETEPSLIQIAKVEGFLSVIPAKVMSQRAMECRSFSRALYYWEQYIRQQKDHGLDANELENLYERLQDIYTHIDEPDGIEGISSHLQVLNIDQQVLEHRKAGRWTAVQSWYELQLTEKPEDTDVQLNLLSSLRESGQHDVLLSTIAGLHESQATLLMTRPFAVEASWVTGKWDKLDHYLLLKDTGFGGDFNIGIGSALLALYKKDFHHSREIIGTIQESIARGLSAPATTSLQACHDDMLKFHILSEIEAISGLSDGERLGLPSLLTTLDQRLNVLGAFFADKQFLLGLRRAAMQLSSHDFSKLDLSSAWLTSARLARKGNFTHQAFNAVLHASQLGDTSATIEHSRLLWREGHHRKAIQSLEGAIAANAFRSHDYVSTNDNAAKTQQNILTARAHLLLAKWIDRAGQTQSDVIIQQYKKAVDLYNRWEKGHYYLGKHYNKLLDSEKAKSPAKQAQTFITGETAKLVIENYLRSLAFGAKYIYQTLPRVLTLWLDLGNDVDKPLDPKYGNDENFRAHTLAQRRKLFGAVNAQVKKYIDRLPPFVFYTAFAQIVARICHSNQSIQAMLIEIVAKVVTTHPQQALWTLLAMLKSSSKERSHRGVLCMTKIVDNIKKLKTEAAGTEVRALMSQGQRLSEELLRLCNAEVPDKVSIVSLTKQLKFKLTTAPCRLVIPLESTLGAILPTVTDSVNMKTHKAFPKDTITISTFLDDVLVLNSLQRPRKVSVRGSDGRVYGLLCKPKDDLRKDQRLMEFNAMINRSLKRDAESSKRRLYIKTYAVTPLNEECGLIEWVDNLKTLRDILLRIYKQKNITVNYNEIKILLDQASSDVNNIHIFKDTIISQFPPVFHEWFVDMFPEPGAWFAARLKYTRSCAVMSIVGHVLGLGDRHGENILFEEGNGGTFHVDFNCMFDKGLTFEKPELVPFRLTHNMVDAFGAYGFDGPFRKSCELTLGILRGNEDTLMTILETFLYDPTTDFIGKKKRSTGVPDTPEGVLESVRSKVRGLLPMESVPLSVEGYVDELIQQATDPVKLAGMYIGWCAFF